MQSRKPILCATDLNTDVGSDAEKNGYGYWCESGNFEQFIVYIELLSEDSKLRSRLGNNAYKFLNDNFSVENSYSTLMNHFNNDI